MNNNKDISPKNAKGQKHGYCEEYLSNGNLFFKCVYHNGKEIGYLELYGYITGKIRIKRYYL